MEFQNMLANVYKKIEHRNELQDEQTILAAEINQLKSKQYRLKENVDKETSDVIELERKSIASWLARLSGRLEEQLEKEQREARTARAEYEKVEERLRNGIERLTEIAAALEILQEEELDVQYENLLQEKRRAMELRQDELPEDVRKVETELGKLKEQLERMNEAKLSAIDAEAAAKQLDETISNAKAFMEFSGVGFRNPIEAGIKHRAEKQVDAADSIFSESASALMHYQEILGELDAVDQFDIPFGFLEEIRGKLSCDNYPDLSDHTDKMRRLWARIYESMKLLDQLEEEILREFLLKKERWKRLVYEWPEK